MIFLIGYMASGKSTLGRSLADRMNREFIDLDDRVVERCGLTIPEIFTQHGEDYFRGIEQEVLFALAGTENVVVATGGGTPCHPGNLDWMKKHGTTVYLKWEAEELYRRLIHDNTERPLLSGIPDHQRLDFVRKHLQAREAFYHQADVVLQGESGSAEDTVNQLVIAIQSITR